MPSRKSSHVRALSQVFRVLSDQTRLRLLLALQDGEHCVSELCRSLRLRQPTVSHHLGLLRIHGLVRNRRQGKLVFYAVDPAQKDRIRRAMDEVFPA